MAHRPAHRRDALTLLGPHRRDADLQLGNAGLLQGTGDRHLLGAGKGDTRRLFTIPQGGVVDGDLALHAGSIHAKRIHAGCIPIRCFHTRLRRRSWQEHSKWHSMFFIVIYQAIKLVSAEFGAQQTRHCRQSDRASAGRRLIERGAFIKGLLPWVVDAMRRRGNLAPTRRKSVHGGSTASSLMPTVGLSVIPAAPFTPRSLINPLSEEEEQRLPGATRCRGEVITQSCDCPWHRPGRRHHSRCSHRHP